MKNKCTYKITEHLLKNEGINVMQEENNSLEVKKYTDNLKKMIQENMYKDKLMDINITTEETRGPDHNVIVNTEEEMDVTLSVDPSLTHGTDPPVVDITATAGVDTANDTRVTVPEMAPAVVTAPEIAPAADASSPVTSGVPATAGDATFTVTSGQIPTLVSAATSNAAVTNGATTPVIGATLAVAPGQAPALVTTATDNASAAGGAPAPATATASGIAKTHTGTQRDPATPYNAGDASDGGDNTELCRYHKYRKCMRGERCKYKHPAVCQNVKDFGLCQSRECDLTHQLVCINFWITGSCARSDYCGFIHPKIIQQRVQMDNRRRNVRNKGHNQNRRDHQQKYLHTS